MKTFTLFTALVAAVVVNAQVDPATVPPCIAQCSEEAAASVGCGNIYNVDCVCKQKNSEFQQAAIPCLTKCGGSALTDALGVMTKLCSEGIKPSAGPTSEAPAPTSEAPAPSSEAPAPSSENPAPTGGSSESPAPTGGSSEGPAPTGGSSEGPAPTGGSSEGPAPTGGSSGSSEGPAPTGGSSEGGSTATGAPVKPSSSKPACDPRGGSGACNTPVSVPPVPTLSQVKPAPTTAAANATASGANIEKAGANAGNSASSNKASFGYAAAFILGAVALVL